MKTTFIATGLLLAAALTGCLPLKQLMPTPRSSVPTGSVDLHGFRPSPVNRGIPYRCEHSLYASPVSYAYVWQGYRGVESEHDIYGMRRYSRLQSVEGQNSPYYATDGESYVFEEYQSQPGREDSGDATGDRSPPATIVETVPVEPPLLVPVPPESAGSTETWQGSEPERSLDTESEPVPVPLSRPRQSLINLVPAAPALPAEQHRHRIPRNVVPNPGNPPVQPNRIPRNQLPR